MKEKPTLIDLEPEKATRGKDLRVHPERLSESDPGNRDMRQSDLLGKTNQESKAEMSLPSNVSRWIVTNWSFDCWGFNLRYPKNVTLGNYNLLTTNGVKLARICGDTYRKLRITGNLSERRQSRGVNQMNYARTTAKEQLFELVIQSDLMGDHERPAEMTGPFLQGRVTTENLEGSPREIPSKFLCFQFIIGTDSNYLTVPIKLGGMVERSILKTGNNGETLDQESRQSRGVNQMNYARETYNRGLSESVIKSVLAGDRKRSAEMTDPFPQGRVTKSEDIASGVDSSAAESVAVSPHVGQGDTDNFYRFDVSGQAIHINSTESFRVRISFPSGNAGITGERLPPLGVIQDGKPTLIDLDPGMGTRRKDRMIQRERLSESDPGNRDMRQSELLGMSNQERRGRRTPPAKRRLLVKKVTEHGPVNPRLHSGYLVQGNLMISFV